MKDPELAFEDALQELEAIAGSLERDDLRLEEALELFEKGIERLRGAAFLLDAAHGRVEELVSTAGGDLAVLPFEPGDGAEEAADEGSPA